MQQAYQAGVSDPNPCQLLGPPQQAVKKVLLANAQIGLQASVSLTTNATP